MEQDNSIRLFVGSGMPRNLWRRVNERFAPARVLEFYASPDGQNDYASAAYQRFLGVGERELRGYGWKNYIAPEESALYLADQEACIRERRRFQRRVNMVRSNGVRALVDVTITMYPDDRDQGLQSLMGHIRPVPS